jgi:enamine deaminase RidA (YjgF/YER057c/UK114 family)
MLFLFLYALYTGYMVVMSASGGGRLEKAASYARAKRVGPFVFIAGTTAMQSTGKVRAPYDVYKQTVYILKQIDKHLRAVGAEMRHVVRTRAYLTDMRDAGGFIRAHGEVFKGIEPVLTGLTTPGMMVEVEVDAIIHSADGEIVFD